MRCPAGKAGSPVGSDVDELEPLRDDGVVARLDLVGDEEEERGLGAIVGRIHEDRALAHEIAVLLQDEVADGKHERMTRVDHLGESSVGPVKRADGFFGEADTLVAFQHGGQFAAIAPGDLAVTLADKGGDVGDFEAARLAGIHGPVESFECLHEKRADEIRLQPAGFGDFHLLLHGEKALGAHGFLRERVAFEEVFDVGDVESVVDALESCGVALGLVVVADGVQQQILEASFLEDFAENVEDAAFESIVDIFELGEQAVINLALAGFLGHEIPKVTYLLLANAVEAPETLFKAVRIPRQVIIDHEVGVLEVHAFSGGIGREQDADFRIGAEHFLPLAAFITMHAAVNGGDGFGGAEDATDSAFQIV